MAVHGSHQLLLENFTNGVTSALDAKSIVPDTAGKNGFINSGCRFMNCTICQDMEQVGFSSLVLIILHYIVSSLFLTSYFTTS